MESKLDNPLVSFVLLGYNQEKYIGEAIESAFNQCYTPMEIIISDDCSTDNTYQIMKEMAAAYVGPHSIIVRQSVKNQGIAKHFFSAAKLANGVLVVEAGGDDVSKLDRTEKIVHAWKKTDAWGIYSRFDKISEDGELIAESNYLQMENHVIRNYWLHGDEVSLMHGAVSAYTRNAILLIENELPSIMTEDGVISVALHLHDKPVHLMDESLVLYRVNPQAVSNSGLKANMSCSDIIQTEHKASKMAFYSKNFNEWLLNYKSKLEGTSKSRSVLEFNECEVKSDIQLYSMMESWSVNSSFLKRARFLFNYPRLCNWRWMLPRIFGLKVFSYIKFMINKIR